MQYNTSIIDTTLDKILEVQKMKRFLSIFVVLLIIGVILIIKYPIPTQDSQNINSFHETHKTNSASITAQNMSSNSVNEEKKEVKNYQDVLRALGIEEKKNEEQKDEEKKDEISYTPSLEVVSSNIEYSDDYTKWLTGIVRNNTVMNYKYVEIYVNFYDDDGNLVGSDLTNVTDLGPQETWKFKIPWQEGASTYKIINVKGIFQQINVEDFSRKRNRAVIYKDQF